LSPDQPAGQALMLLLAKYPDMLSHAADGCAARRDYLRELAACYHSYYDAEQFWSTAEPSGWHGWHWWRPPRRCCTITSAVLGDQCPAR
jgi:hypothetical protein